MKTNNFTKTILAILAILTVCLFSLPAFADSDPVESISSGSDSTRNDETIAPEFAETETEKTEAEPETVQNNSQPMPGKQSHKNTEMKGQKHPKHQGKHQEDRADFFEDWFEDRIDSRKKHVDFSELGDDPTDEQILEFFKKYFLDEDDQEKSMKDNNCTKGDKSFSGNRNNPHHPNKTEPDSTIEAAPETISETPAEESIEESSQDAA